MIKKQGITMISVTVAVIVLTILVGVIAVSTHSTINYARLVTWVNEVTYVQDAVDEAKNTTLGVPYTTEAVIIVVSNLSSEELNDQFSGENISSGKVELNVLNLGELKITNTKYGNLKTANDLYAYSTKTGKVYYAQGVEIDGVVYYTLTDELRGTFNLSPANDKLSSVVFVPSIIGHTNEPIEVTVKLPTSFTNISITTSNIDVLVGSQTVVGTTYEYNVNTSKVIGNYDIIVTYTNGSQSYTTTYSVNGYDTTKPVIAEIEYENIIYSPEHSNTSDYITGITATDESGIKVIKYALGTITEDQAMEYFKENGNNVIDQKINTDNSKPVYTIYAEDNAGNFSILTFNKKYVMPDDWKASVSYIEDGVPIPKGLTTSQYEDETNKDTGMVIYGDDDGDIDEETQYEMWIGRDQYVWIPVDDFDDFVRKDYGMGYNLVNTLGSDYWEVVLNLETNMPLTTQNSNFVTNATQSGGVTNTLAEAQAMYASVKKYGGFYIGRYEAGIDEMRTTDDKDTLETKVYSSMGKIPYTYVKWGNSMADDTGGAVQAARSVYPVTNDSYGVASTLVYGVQWDAVLKTLEAKYDLTANLQYGNYLNHEIASADELNEGAQVLDFDNSTEFVDKDSSALSYPKDIGDQWLLTTGALKDARIYNLYDIMGNLCEWTMEGYGNANRVVRGAAFGCNNTDYSLAFRGHFESDSNELGYGFRVALYIK